MIDTLDNIEPPYRQGDSDKTERKVAWPSVEDAKRRIGVQINGRAADNVAIDAADLIVVMRELGRLMAAHADVEGCAKRIFAARFEHDHAAGKPHWDKLDDAAKAIWLGCARAALKDKP